jgi:predicted  nucleic acid-binding Zn-ribbon protein
MVVITMIFSSCKKYELSEQFSIESLPTVTLTGSVTAPLENGKMLFVPQGTIISFSITNNQYDIHVDSEAGKHVITATVDASGKYSVNIPVTSVGVSVQVTSNNFYYDYKESDIVTYKRNFKFNDRTISCLPNKNLDIDLTFAVENIYLTNEIVPTKNVTISGKLEYQSNLNTSSYEIDTVAIPQGTQFKATIELTEYNATSATYKQEIMVTVGANGAYSINVPMIVDGKAIVELEGVTNLQYVVKNGTDIISDHIYRHTLDQMITVYEVPLTNKNFVYTRGAQLN